MSSIGIEVLIILVLILANGIFALAEIALVSSRKHRLQQQAVGGNRKAGIALELANQPNEMLSTVQIGITLIGTLAGAFGGATVAEEIAAGLDTFPQIAPHGESVALGIVVLAITVLSIILGELVPKRLALTNPELFATALAPFMRTLSKLASPAVRFMGWTTDLVLKLFPKPHSEEKGISEEDIKVLIDQGTQAGTFEESEQEMVKGVFQLADRSLAELMQPRMKIAWLDIDEKPEGIRNVIETNSYSRFLLAARDLDHVLGYVHVKDLLSQCAVGQPMNLRSCMRPLPGVPEAMTALKALETFKNSGTHVALVVNEHGGTEGLITLNDIVEAIVGDLAASDDETEQWADRREDGSWLIAGAIPAFEFKELLGIRTLSGETEGTYRTLGGFMLMKLGHIPCAGEHFETQGWRFEVVDMDGRRIDKVLVSAIP